VSSSWTVVSVSRLIADGNSLIAAPANAGAATHVGVFEAVVERFDMSPGCPDGRRGSGSVGFGFWVNAVTTLDAQRAEDPRPALRDVSTPMLVLRGKCDYIAWEATASTETCYRALCCLRSTTRGT
jgi:hypothetical protein